jgi:predicted nucleotidyltransferase
MSAPGARDERTIGRFMSLVREAFGERLLAALLFGSKARGDGDDLSDTDVLLVIEGLRPEDREAASRAAWEAGIGDGAVICALCYSAEEFDRQMRLPFLREALREGLSL